MEFRCPKSRYDRLQPGHPAVPAIPGGTGHILLVDDEVSVAMIQKKALERLGYRVTSYTGSIETLEAFRNAPEKFDLVITDMEMPQMQGDALSPSPWSSVSLPASRTSCWRKIYRSDPSGGRHLPADLIGKAKHQEQKGFW